MRYAYVRADMSELWGESKTFFALDAQTGELLWRYDAEQSIRHNAIAIGAGTRLSDRPGDRQGRQVGPEGPVAQAAASGRRSSSRRAACSRSMPPPARSLWKAAGDAFGTMLAYSQPARRPADGLPIDAVQAAVGSRRASWPSFAAQSGEPLWDKEAKYVTRPLINDRTIYAQGGSWDLLTGEEQPFVFKRSYGCGQLAGSKHMLLFRSATLGYLDLTRGSGVENFGGIRPGCWINALPVGGLVLVPDASAGCQCSYQNRSWMALTGDE